MGTYKHTPGISMAMVYMIARQQRARPHMSILQHGTYMPRVTATDDLGGESTGNFSVVSVTCEVPEGELSLACNPSSGPTGTTITFVGYQWPAGSEIEISFDNEVVITSVTANAQGSFTATWAVPSGTSSGSKHVVANVIGSVTVWSETNFIVE